MSDAEIIQHQERCQWEEELLAYFAVIS